MMTDSMSFTASFFTVSLVSDDYGQQKIVETLLYEDILCKVRDSKNSSGSIQKENGSEQVFFEGFKIIVPKSYNEAKVGDIVVFQEKKYTIAKKFEQKGGSIAKNCIYFIE